MHIDTEIDSWENLEYYAKVYENPDIYGFFPPENPSKITSKGHTTISHV